MRQSEILYYHAKNSISWKKQKRSRDLDVYRMNEESEDISRLVDIIDSR